MTTTPLVAKKFLIIVTFLVSGAVCAQSANVTAVMAPVERLFKGMHEGDSALVHSAFVNTVTFVSVMKNKAGKPVLVPEPLNDFLKAVGTPHAETWSEPVWDVKVETDGIFAQVWAKYAFYVDKKFSHCGVDAFHLIQTDDSTWKIFHLADTRQREGCVVDPAVLEKFK